MLEHRCSWIIAIAAAKRLRIQQQHGMHYLHKSRSIVSTLRRGSHSSLRDGERRSLVHQHCCAEAIAGSRAGIVHMSLFKSGGMRQLCHIRHLVVDMQGGSVAVLQAEPDGCGLLHDRVTGPCTGGPVAVAK